MNKSIGCFENLGYTIEKSAVYDNIRLVDVCFLVNKEYRVELICPLADSPVSPMLKRYKNSPYHICYQHPDLDMLITEWDTSGNILIQPPMPAPAINGKRVAFFMTPAGLTEILETD